MSRAEFDHRFRTAMRTVQKSICRYSVLAGCNRVEVPRMGRRAPGGLYDAIRLRYSYLRLKHVQIRIRSKYTEDPGQLN